MNDGGVLEHLVRVLIVRRFIDGSLNGKDELFIISSTWSAPLGLDLKGNAGFANCLRSDFPEWVDYVGGPPQHVLCKGSTQFDVKTGWVGYVDRATKNKMSKSVAAQTMFLS